MLMNTDDFELNRGSYGPPMDVSRDHFPVNDVCRDHFPSSVYNSSHSPSRSIMVYNATDIRKDGDSIFVTCGEENRDVVVIVPKEMLKKTLDDID